MRRQHPLHRATINRASWLVVFLALGSCSLPDPAFDTHSDQASLKSLVSVRIGLISFRHIDHTIIGAEPAPLETADLVLARDKKRFLASFGQIVPMSDTTAVEPQRDAAPIDLNNPESIATVLRDRNVDAGVFVTESFGFDRVGGDLSDAAREKILKTVVSDKTARAINGPVTIQDYDMASDIRIYDGQGRLIWRLFGKAQDWPRDQDIFDPGEFARSFAGLDPSQQTMVRSFGRMTDLYTDFGVWSLRAGMNGGPMPTFRTFMGDRRSSMTISPAESTAYAPFICGYDVLEPSRKQAGTPEPEECLDSSN